MFVTTHLSFTLLSNTLLITNSLLSHTYLPSDHLDWTEALLIAGLFGEEERACRTLSSCFETLVTVARQNALWDDTVGGASTGGFTTLLGLVCRRIGETLENSSLRGVGEDGHTMVFVSSNGSPIILSPMGFMQVTYETLATRYTEIYPPSSSTLVSSYGTPSGSNSQGGSAMGIRATATVPTMRLCYLELCQLSRNGRKIAGNLPPCLRSNCTH